MDKWNEFLTDQESNDGVRFTWNLLPYSAVESRRLVVPIVAFYNPLKERQKQSNVLEYDPLICQKNACKAILNPLCQVDFRAKSWICAVCSQRNIFPTHYGAINEQHCPPELNPALTTVEYVIKKATTMPSIFLYVVDTSISCDELKNLKESIQMSLSKLPADALVGLITYGRMVQLHELTFEGITRCYVFKGTKEVTLRQVREIIMSGSKGSAVGSHTIVSNKFLKPISECGDLFKDLIEQITVDHWPVPQGHRPIRATGAAFAVAVTLLETCFPNTGARILTFVGGSCNIGPGAVVGEELKNPIRSWHNIKEEDAPFMKKAIKFYDSLADRVVRNGHAIDIFSCSLDQTGLMEMSNLFNMPGGLVFMGDSFSSTLFKQSFQRLFDKDSQGYLKMGFNATMEVKCGLGLKVGGALGCCASSNVKSSCVSETETGIGGTCQWKFGSLMPRTTIGCVLEVSAQHGSAMPQGARAVVQFLTQYQHPDGRKRIRVTTTQRSWADMATQQHNIMHGFDQEAGAVAMARMATWRAANENDAPEALRWLDRSLIRLCQKFGEYQKDIPDSFRFPDNLSLFPQLMFHLRRSQFLQVFNNSPDETAYYRNVLFTENVLESTTMIQPVLFSYGFSGPPEPVLLDTSSIKADRILLMDDYFHVLIYHGQQIATWIKMKYHKDPNYASFAQLLEAPKADAAAILQERFPMARYIETEYEGSQARFLLSKVNPSLTHNNPYAQDGGAPVFTDDVSLQIFMEHLKKLATSSST